ncbi:TPA: hypothetical protein ACT15G_005837 [Raoultella planticola]
MNIETVNELIQSLESAGELTIREEKFLKLARAYVQLAADNVVLKSAHPQPFGPEMMKALEAYEKQQDEAPETGMLDAFFILRDSIRVETPATDRIVAEIKADGVEEWVSSRGGRWNGTTEEALKFAKQLREGKSEGVKS